MSGMFKDSGIRMTQLGREYAQCLCGWYERVGATNCGNAAHEGNVAKWPEGAPSVGLHARAATAESEHAAALLEIERLKLELAASETLKRAAIDGNEAMVASLLKSEAGAVELRDWCAAWLIRARLAIYREGWEEGMSANEAAEALTDVLANLGCDDGTEDAEHIAETKRLLALPITYSPPDAGAAFLHERAALRIQLSDALNRAALAETDTARLKTERDTPEVLDFAKAVALEAQHQRARWGSDHDAGKADADWFWLIGYLAGKALHNPGGEADKQLHRIITIAAAAANWHAAKLGKTNMRPGIDGDAALASRGDNGPADHLPARPSRCIRSRLCSPRMTQSWAHSHACPLSKGD